MIPSNFNASFCFAHDRTKFKLAHFIRADLLSVAELPLLTQTRQVFLTKPMPPVEYGSSIVKLYKNVHTGLFGLNKQPSEFNFSVDKTTYAPGEDIKFNILCDNEASTRDLTYIKCELYLRYTKTDNAMACGDILVESHKFTGSSLQVKRGDKKMVILTLPVPIYFSFDYKKTYRRPKSLQLDDKVLVRRLPPSYDSPELHLSYYVRIAVDHEGMFGNKVRSDPI